MENIQTRMDLVLYNHMLSCHNTDYYLYILRGFDEFLDDFKINIDKYDGTFEKRRNYYVLEDELKDLDMRLFNDHKKAEVVFNFFEDNMVYQEGEFIKLNDLDLDIKDKICIFHQVNQLDRVTDDKLNNEERLNYLRQ